MFTKQVNAIELVVWAEDSSDKYEGLDEILEELDSSGSAWIIDKNQLTPEELQEFGL